MLTFIARRLAAAVPTLLVILALSFFLMRLAPGGPFSLEKPLEPKAMEALQRLYKLDRPLPEQLVSYLGGLVRGDLGPSFVHRDFTVAELIGRGLPISMLLGALALAVALALGIVLGTWAALEQNRTTDHVVTGLATLGLTVPSFVAAPLLQIVLALWLAWLPVAGWGEGAVRNLVMPVVVLALPQIAVIARLTRGAMIETLRSNHIRTLQALGLPRRTVLVRALRGAALPVVSYLGPAAAGLLTGSVVVETIFGLPGIGRYFVEAALNRDYPLVMGTVLVVAVLVIALNLAVDVVHALIDPRLRSSL